MDKILDIGELEYRDDIFYRCIYTGKKRSGVHWVDMYATSSQRDQICYNWQFTQC